MTLTYPLTGRDVNGRIPLSGRAAIWLPSGSGFNWRNVAHHSSGWVTPRGLRGLGQGADPGYIDTSIYSGSGSTDGSGSTIYTTPGDPLPTGDAAQGSTNNTKPPGSGSVPTWLQNIFTSWSATGQTILKQQTNPLQNVVSKGGTYYQTPQGLIYATGASGAGVPGLTTTNLSSYLPLLMIGGVGLVLVMAMSRR